MAARLVSSIYMYTELVALDWNVKSQGINNTAPEYTTQQNCSNEMFRKLREFGLKLTIKPLVLRPTEGQELSTDC